MNNTPQTPTAQAAPTRALPWRLAMALLSLAAALVGCFWLYRTWPVLLPLLGAGCTGLLLARLLPARLGSLRLPWVPQIVAALLWLVYAMQVAYGWRLELGYWASLGLVFGWPFILTLFWALLARWALPRFLGLTR